MRGPSRAGAGTESLHGLLRRGLTVLALVLALALGTTLVAVVQADRRLTDVTDLFFRAVTEGDLGYLALVEAEAGLRAYAATGDPVTLGALEAFSGGDVFTPEVTSRDVGEDLEAHFGADHPTVQARHRADELLAVWLEEHAEPLVAAVGAGGPDAVRPAQVTAASAAFEDFRVEMERYLGLIREDRHDARRGLELWEDVLAASVVVLAVLLVTSAIAIWVVLRRWITEPLVRLADDARTIADGDVHHSVATGGRGEVGAVAHDVELMRERLAGLYAEAIASREEIERSHALLEEQAEDLRRSNRDLEQFAYVASHDLQEPLRKVASFTQLLAKRYEGQLDERADQYIGFAVDGAKRMQRLINDLLGFSRVGRIGGEVSEVDLKAVLEDVKGDLSEVIEESGATVVGEGLPSVPGERPLLTQLVQNLVSNALKFRDPERPPHVRLTARRDGAWWELACADNGIGIDPQYADRVFVIFQRLHAKDVYEGTGIGLALCKKIVEYHGGQIWIDPDPGEGTTIRWTLPVDAGTAPATRDREDGRTPEAPAARLAGRTTDG